MKILITGANGFIAKNFISHLKEKKEIEILAYTKDKHIDELSDLISKADIIFHLAGVNRPKEVSEFSKINIGLTEIICKLAKQLNKKVPIVFSSSTQADLENDYGRSKYEAEQLLNSLSKDLGNKVFNLRLPNVFGKWCRPNYNSVVATFCYNISHELPIKINNPETKLSLIYIDDLIFIFFKILENINIDASKLISSIEYVITLKELSEILIGFRESRNNLIIDRVGTGLIRALYSTYISYLEPNSSKYEIKQFSDNRGVFVEMLKTKDSGQISFLTAYPGITRGNHYHHSKTEKFLVVKGKARFNFKHILSDEFQTIYVSGEKLEIVETIPGWAHDITNVGDEELVVLLWANEVFDKNQPDTYIYKF